MNKFAIRLAVAAGIAACAGVASALQFVDIQVTGDASVIGTLGTDTTWNVFDKDIDFGFSKACVGDNLPLRSSTINITFEVKSDPAKELIVCDLLSASVLTKGSGFVQITEFIEDFTNGGPAYGPLSVNTATTSGGVLTGKLEWPKGSSHIKVKKSIFLDATADTNVRDLACIGLMEQRFKTVPVPEPATILGLGTALAAIVARRKKG
ncbi:MAG: PEP-CTERM sorting domain-containing protein [Chthonomonas sp.]|nr:PEP-CTERM sorting domain-containing protein [Chthonomonas sp.]